MLHFFLNQGFPKRFNNANISKLASRGPPSEVDHLLVKATTSSRVKRLTGSGIIATYNTHCCNVDTAFSLGISVEHRVKEGYIGNKCNK